MCACVCRGNGGWAWCSPTTDPRLVQSQIKLNKNKTTDIQRCKRKRKRSNNSNGKPVESGWSLYITLPFKTFFCRYFTLKVFHNRPNHLPFLIFPQTPKLFNSTPLFAFWKLLMFPLDLTDPAQITYTFWYQYRFL